MSVFKFIIKSLWFFRKQHLAVLAGTLISTAVLTGALIVGDSIKFSLQKTVDARLGNVKFAMQTGDRFVSSDLANTISNDLNIKTASLLSLNGIAIQNESNLRINHVQVYGFDQNFWQLSGISMPEISNEEIIISENIAPKLNIKIHDEILLRVEKSNIIPLNAPFAKETEPSVSFRAVVKAIANDENMGRFGLKNIQSAPFNIFISRDFIAQKTELENLSNIILAGNNEQQNISEDDLKLSIIKVWKLNDANIVVRELNEINRIEILSDRIFIDEPIANVIQNLNIPNEKILTYLVNSIRFKDKSTPYSFVTAASSPFLPVMEENEIIITEWLASDLNLKVKDTIELDYYVIGPLRSLEEKSDQFIVKQIIPTQGEIANNSLMPLFPGLADAGSCSEWETGIPIDLSRIREKDEKYWDDYKGTPKAFISIKKGLNLWGNKFGNYTSFRFDKKNINTQDLKSELLKNLNPEDINLSFKPVHQQGIRAATSGVDFGELFLSMSFFIIVAGILLTVLIYSLNTESRSQETGILSGLGFSKRQIIRIRFSESLITIIIGSILGAFAGILYNNAIMAALNTVWQSIVRTNMLVVHIKSTTIFTGIISGTIIALLAIFIITRRKLKQPIIGLIRDSSLHLSSQKTIKRNFYSWISIISFLIVLSQIIYSFTTSIDTNAGLILSAGGLFLFGCIFAMIGYFNRLSFKSSQNQLSFTQLAIKMRLKTKDEALLLLLY